MLPSLIYFLTLFVVSEHTHLSNLKMINLSRPTCNLQMNGYNTDNAGYVVCVYPACFLQIFGIQLGCVLLWMQVFSLLHMSPMRSLVSNPRPANTKSPGNSSLRWPLFSITSLSLTRPPHPWEAKEIGPCGVLPMRYFRVSWRLWWENVCALALIFEALSMRISKQSTITATRFPKNTINWCGMVACKQCLSGQCTKGLKCLNIVPIVSLNVVDTVFWSTEKRYEMCCIGRFSLRRISVERSIWTGESFRPVCGRQGRNCVNTPIRTSEAQYMKAQCSTSPLHHHI